MYAIIADMPAQHTRNISFTPEHDSFVDQKLRSGQYQSASEVVREALRLLQTHEQVYTDALTELRDKVAHGLAQAEAGQLVDGPQTMKRIRAKLAAKAQPSKPNGQ